MDYLSYLLPFREEKEILLFFMTTLLKFNAAPLPEFQSVLASLSLSSHFEADFVPFEVEFFAIQAEYLLLFTFLKYVMLYLKCS